MAYREDFMLEFWKNEKACGVRVETRRWRWAVCLQWARPWFVRWGANHAEHTWPRRAK